MRNKASILLVQMQKLQKIIKINNSISKVFDTFFSKYDFIKILKLDPVALILIMFMVCK